MRTMTTKLWRLGILYVVALNLLLSVPVQAAGPSPLDHFSILLEGTYEPVVHAPHGNLGLFTVDLSDGSYSKTKIYRVRGLPEQDCGQGNSPGDCRIGTFYTQFSGLSAVYDLPGGSLAMIFTDFSNFNTAVPDGEGGTYFVGTIKLVITEGTGAYQSFVGGNNTMVDILHMLADGTFVEHCICIISKP